MKTQKRNRYFCDFCRKSGGSAGHMVRHEKHCTMNPNRSCRMCDALGQTTPEMSAMLAVLPKPSEHMISETVLGGFRVNHYPGLEVAVEGGLKALREIAGTCPACILAALRQSGVLPYVGVIAFNYREEVDAMWKHIRDEEYQAEMDSYH